MQFKNANFACEDNSINVENANIRDRSDIAMLKIKSMPNSIVKDNR